MADPYSHLELERFTITEHHDIVVRVIEYKMVSHIEGAGEGAKTVEESVPSRLVEFAVKRQVLIKHSEYFATLLTRDRFAEGRQSKVDIQDDKADGMKIWFEAFHDAFTTESRKIDLEGIWYMLAAGHKYGFKKTMLQKWFAIWFDERNSTSPFDYEDLQQLLYPCHVFDYSKGFAQATKYLAYNATGHIVEKRPTDFHYEHHHLDDQRIIQQINAARGRLKTVLHRGLYKPIENLLQEEGCTCRETALFGYEKALSRTGAWPLETTFIKKSMNTILEKLKKFPTSFTPASSDCGGACGSDFGLTVAMAQKETTKYFDGLCLDCMNGSKFDNKDTDYWHHADRFVKWDEGCRIRHDQPTWYFSFMGRRTKQAHYNRRPRGDRNYEDTY